ncbi:DNA repair protein RadC [uncultured Selenomonas sp.]|uniref:RadC family protein n=1 Tax=uncultured Selenomonas sp. TaxID=159275 RepID=UPI00261A7696|nr:DNA repair protein RadC [uncultured Selenomonas sp.]
MTLLVRDLPVDERPRERLLSEGAASLSNTELLAVLLRTGVKNDSALRVAEKVLALYKERGLAAITQMSAKELSSIKGVGMAKAATILAAVELGRRLALKAAEARTVVHGPADAASYVMPRFRFERREHFAVLLLNAKNHILALKTISVGTLTSSVVHPREVFQAAIEQSAASVILVHNHPSGDPAPSGEDLAVTRRMVEAGEIMDIPVLDHVIVGYDKFISLKEEGMIQ